MSRGPRTSQARGEKCPSDASRRSLNNSPHTATKTHASKPHALPKRSIIHRGKRTATSIPHEMGDSSTGVSYVGVSSGMGSVSTAGAVVNVPPDESVAAGGTYSYHVGDGDSDEGVGGRVGSAAGNSSLVNDKAMGGGGSRETDHRDDVLDERNRGGYSDDAQSVPEDSSSGIESGDEERSPVLRDRNMSSKLSGDSFENSVESFSSSVLVETGHGSD